MFVCTVSKSLVGLGLAGTGITSGIFALPGPRPKLPAKTASTQSTEISATSTSSESKIATTNPTTSSPTTFTSHGRTVETSTIVSGGGEAKVAGSVVLEGQVNESRGNSSECDELDRIYQKAKLDRGDGAQKEQNDWINCLSRTST